MISKESILEKIKETLETLFQNKVSNINEETNLSEFDLDSLDAVMFVMELEKVYDIAIPDEEAEVNFNKNNSVEQMVNYLFVKVNYEF